MSVSVSYTTVSVSDMDKALAYYRDTIGMLVVSDATQAGESLDRLLCLKGVKARTVVLRLKAGSNLRLVQHLAHKGRPIASTLRQFDIAPIHLDFACKKIEGIYDDFQAKGVKTFCPVQEEHRFKFKSFSFDAPDGVRMETHDFWVKHWWLPEVEEKGFYALAHTALSVGNMDRTLHLYRDILGLKILRESHLEGEGFDRMDSLQGGIAQNCVVRAEQGSEIQFIWHYAGTHGGKGKPIASTLQQCDIGIVNIGLKADDIEELHKRLRKEGVTVNYDVQVDPDKKRCFSFRDPDGNLLIAHD